MDTLASSFKSGRSASQHSTKQRILLSCGILSSLVYVAANILGALQWNGYSLLSQTVSEQSAIDAPSRPLMVGFMLAYGALVAAFGVGVWGVAGRSRAFRIAAGLLVTFGVVCMLGPLTPMHQREVLAAGGGTLTDDLHIAFTIVDVALIVLIIGFGAAALGRRFRLYSMATIGMLLAFGAMAGVEGPRLEQNLPTPLLGLWERLNIGLFLLWMVVFTIVISKGSQPGAEPKPA